MAHPNYIGCTRRCRMMDELGEPHKGQYLSWMSQKERHTLKDFHGFVLPGHASTLMHRNIFSDSDDAHEAIITIYPLTGDRSLSLLLASQGAVYQLSDTTSCYRFSCTVERRNTTAVAYTRNTSQIREDYDYTKKLEVYALQMLGVDGDFPAYKKLLFINAVWVAFKHPNTENFQIIAQILREGQPFDHLFTLPAGALYELREKHKQGS